MKKKMGQAPLILGPSSWGAGMAQAPIQLVCPPGTRLLSNGTCVQPGTTVVPMRLQSLAGRRR